MQGQSRSIDQRSGERETLVKSKTGQIRSAVEKRFSFLVLYFIVISLTSRERCPKQCGRALMRRKDPPYFQKARGLRVRVLCTAVSRNGLTHWPFRRSARKWVEFQISTNR